MKVICCMTRWSEKTALAYLDKYRKLVAGFMSDFIASVDNPDYVSFDEGQIGGENVEVQIDESAFGRRKYNRGHHVETKWVFGGVEIVPDNQGKKRW